MIIVVGEEKVVPRLGTNFPIFLEVGRSVACQHRGWVASRHHAALPLRCNKAPSELEGVGSGREG